eukprot:9494555-Pyramimonas_sp.AAC.1
MDGTLSPTLQAGSAGNRAESLTVQPELRGNANAEGEKEYYLRLGAIVAGGEFSTGRLYYKLLVCVFEPAMPGLVRLSSYDTNGKKPVPPQSSLSILFYDRVVPNLDEPSSEIRNRPIIKGNR